MCRHFPMHMKSIALLASLLSVLSFSSCGASAGANNVAACKTFYTALKCGTTDLSGSTSTCDSYANTTCDISGYFACLQTHYVCSNGMYDSAKQSTIGECAAKAVCK